MITTPKPRERHKNDLVQPVARPRQFVEKEFLRDGRYHEHRRKVRDIYDGFRGATLIAFSTLSGHLALAGRLFQSRTFDLSGRKNILDVGAGAGQLAGGVLRYCDDDASLTCVDLSLPMLQRARRRLKSDVPMPVVGDISRLPFADNTFDCITCGYVIEHLPNARMGMAELARVLVPRGRLLLLTTEDNLLGAWTSRLWRCRTYNRRDLRRTCQELDFLWRRDLWFSPLHKRLGAGGICAELQKRG